jgi:hypothetical protein
MKIAIHTKYMTLIPLLLAAALITACGNKNKAGTPPPPPGGPAAPPPVAYQTLNLPVLNCAQQGGCPSPMGELVTVTAKGAKFCTITLVGPDVALTASNCITRENLNADRTYRGNCWVRFPASPAAPIPCQSVALASDLKMEQDDVIQLDYAFIKLAAPAQGRKWLKLADDNEMGPVSKRRRGEVIVYGTQVGSAQHTLRRLKCTADTQAKLHTRKDGPVRHLKLPNCPADASFFGGPIINPVTGNILGVISFIEAASQKDKRPAIIVGTYPDRRLP